MTAPLPTNEKAEISIRRSIFDQILLRRAQSLGTEVREGETLLAIEQGISWKIRTDHGEESAQVLVAADGRNSTVARLCNLMPRKGPNRVALQTHIPLPADFGERIVLQLLREGYSGQAPVGDGLLNLCLVSRPDDIPPVRRWAESTFTISANQAWRSITPLARPPLPANRDNLFLIGDAARVVEPFTGEGIYYALRTGELAAQAILAGNHRQYALAHRRLYAGRLWVNALARRAVEHPFLTTGILRFLPNEKQILELLTRKVVLP